MESGADPSIVAALTEMWRDVLIIDDVTPETNFFQSGGDSLKATALMVHIEESYDLVVDPVEVFENPTLYDFARFVESLMPQKQVAAFEQVVI